MCTIVNVVYMSSYAYLDIYILMCVNMSMHVVSMYTVDYVLVCLCVVFVLTMAWGHLRI